MTDQNSSESQTPVLPDLDARLNEAIDVIEDGRLIKPTKLWRLLDDLRTDRNRNSLDAVEERENARALMAELRATRERLKSAEELASIFKERCDNLKAALKSAEAKIARVEDLVKRADAGRWHFYGDGHGDGMCSVTTNQIRAVLAEINSSDPISESLDKP